MRIDQLPHFSVSSFSMMACRTCIGTSADDGTEVLTSTPTLSRPKHAPTIPARISPTPLTISPRAMVSEWMFTMDRPIPTSVLEPLNSQNQPPANTQ